MSIGDLSLHQPVFSQFSVAAMSVDCYLSHSSSDLNQRWRLQKILPPTAPPPPPTHTHTHTSCQPKSLHYKLKANVTPMVIISRRGGRGGEEVEGGEGMEENERRRACSQAILYTYLFNCGY